jgi:hypothetical protein
LTPELASVPFYWNWEFWTVMLALAALILSQLPPIWQLVRRGKLNLEAHDRVHIAHTLGHPNTQMHVIAINEGGRAVRVRRITLTVQRGQEPPFTLSGRSYFQNAGDTSPILFTPFTVGPKHEWAHIVLFSPNMPWQEEQQLRQVQSAVRGNIEAKREQLEDKDQIVEADQQVVALANAYFEAKFKWGPGEYSLTVALETDPASARVEKRYRITLFESDTADLRGYPETYKYGLGVYYFNTQRHPGVFPTLTEV